MLDILERITAGKGKMEDLETLESLSKNIKIGSLCGLGRTAPNPVISTLEYFREEYIAHIEGYCPSKKCEHIITYSINTDCIGCSKCAQRCPTDAISGSPHNLYEIDGEKCIKCDICKQICPTDAVEIK
jgi:Na+-translocating ferredoxin:NAD+ oxidoreductase RNF subunit RnfB